jgi:hypothetical protein
MAAGYLLQVRGERGPQRPHVAGGGQMHAARVRVVAGADGGIAAAPASAAALCQPGRRDGPGVAGRLRGSAGLTTETQYIRHAVTVP